MRSRDPGRVLRAAALFVVVPTLGLLPAVVAPAAARPAHETGSYRNPIEPRIPGGGVVESCADPAVLKGRQPGDRHWYLYCTTDPLNDADTAGPGGVTFHPMPMMRSTDLVHWTYVGDALPEPPSWAAEGAGLWAPDVVHSRALDRYYLTFTVTDVDDAVSGEPGCTSDSAIGVATSTSPTGPWTVSDAPLVAPRRNGEGCDFLWTFDPDVLGDSVGRSSVFYYGSYLGGVHAQRVRLDATGMTRVGASTQVSIGNRYEGANVIRRGGWYYLFGSATNCCAGPLTGYSVFAGRSRSPFGPFVDRDGSSLLAGRVGGTPVVSMNGNRWVGTGHNSVFSDHAGQWWTAYHAADRFDPYFESEPGFTKRPVLLDPLDWVSGWPTVRAGRWASDQRMPAPAAQPGQRSSYRPRPVREDRPGARIAALSDSFHGTRLDQGWRWVREPAASQFAVNRGRFVFRTQPGDLSNDTNSAAVLTRATPRGDYLVETRVRLNLPPEGCCHNYVQAGLVVRSSDDAFVKLAHVSIWETRQTEFAKEVPTAAEGTPRYGNTVVGAPSTWTDLRIVKRAVRGPGAGGEEDERYTAYTRQDQKGWVRGGTWTHDLGERARVGLVSMGGAGFTAQFDHLRVSRLRR